ncbi:MAG: ABC transporter substrate-binding protein [Bacilli bacterium]
MKKLLFTLVLLLSLFTITGCTTEENTPDGEYTEVTHSLGTAKVPVDINKVAVFDLGILDIMMNLEIEVTFGFPDGNFPTYLNEVESAANLGSLTEPNIEAIFEYEPDLIIISGRQRDYYNDLNQIAPTIFVEVGSSTYLDDVIKNMRMVANIFDTNEKLSELEENLIDKVNEVKTMDKQGRKALVVLINGANINAYGPGSRFGFVHDELLLDAADATIEVTTHGMQINYEYILSKNPDLILVVDRGSVVSNEPNADILNNEILQDDNGDPLFPIHFLNSAAWYLVSGGYSSTIQMVLDVKMALN